MVRPINAHGNLLITVQMAATARVSGHCLVLRFGYTVADYRRFTVRLRLKTLLPCILLLTPAIKVQLR